MSVLTGNGGTAEDPIIPVELISAAMLLCAGVTIVLMETEPFCLNAMHVGIFKFWRRPRPSFYTRRVVSQRA